MPKAYTFEWNGDKLIVIDMFDAAIGSVDAVLGQTVKAAQASAPRDSGDLANGLGFEPAKREGNERGRHLGRQRVVYVYRRG